MVPYSNVQLVTSPPLGLTNAFSVAEVCVTSLAGFVSTPGAASWGKEAKKASFTVVALEPKALAVDEATRTPTAAITRGGPRFRASRANLEGIAES